MSRDISVKEETLAKAAVIFCQKVYATFPEASVEPLDHHYSDEDLTLIVRLPGGKRERESSDELIRIALEVEDQYGVTILARVESS